jgi:hypothetical protein
MVSVQQELVAAEIRSEQQAAASNDSASEDGLLQLLPPSPELVNPVMQGLYSAQQAVATAEAASNQLGWEPPDACLVETVRHTMWQMAEARCSRSSMEEQDRTPLPTEEGRTGSGDAMNAALQPAGGAHWPPTAAATSPDPPGEIDSPAAGSWSSSRPAHSRARQEWRHRASSPSLQDILGGSDMLAAQPLLSEGLAEQLLGDTDQLPLMPITGQLDRQQQQGSKHHHQQQLQPASPLLAHSCVSTASVVGDSNPQRSGQAGWPGPRKALGLMQATSLHSPVLSAAASCMQTKSEQQAGRPAYLAWPDAPCQRPPAGLQDWETPSLRLPGEGSSAGSSPALTPRLCASGQFGSPLPGGAVPWREAARLASVEGRAAGSPNASSHRRRARVSVTLTPPRQLGDSSPQPSSPAAQLFLEGAVDETVSSPVRLTLASEASAEEATPDSKQLFVGRLSYQASPARASPRWPVIAAHNAARDEPAVQRSPRTASFLRSGSSSPRRLRSAALHTTCSPAASQPLHRLAAGSQTPPATYLGTEDLAASCAVLSPPRCLQTPTNGHPGHQSLQAAWHEAPAGSPGPSTAASLMTPPRSLLDTPGAPAAVPAVLWSQQPFAVTLMGASAATPG